MERCWCILVSDVDKYFGCGLPLMSECGPEHMCEAAVRSKLPAIRCQSSPDPPLSPPAENTMHLFVAKSGLWLLLRSMPVAGKFPQPWEGKGTLFDLTRAAGDLLAECSMVRSRGSLASEVEEQRISGWGLCQSRQHLTCLGDLGQR